jgi:hypothetical protein
LLTNKLIVQKHGILEVGCGTLDPRFSQAFAYFEIAVLSALL